MRNRKIIYIHGAGAQEPGTASCFLKEEIKYALKDYFSMLAPDMPTPDNPDCQTWMEVLDALIHKSDDPVTLVGHSFGASVILKYLSECTIETEIASVLLLAAPFWGNAGWNKPELHLQKVNVGQLSQFDKITFFHCHDDEVVPINHLDEYLDIIPHAEGHILESGGHYLKICMGKIKHQILLNNIQYY